MDSSQGRRPKRLVSEINVTPLVDVMLVLLIIFMITAPMMTAGVDIDLPETTSKALRQNEKPLMVTIDNKRVLTLEGKVVSEKLLPSGTEKASRLAQERVSLPQG
ncbi:related to biopolymer transport protein (TolR) [Desulfotalea psychrophila LSv54]|uniref:Related to biopolymer transport protein (TolR) n=1 Tax=Desulfotalea psychrophila (strain LSv54 / DSM 12343) TaxID=177439 RepID=Q6AKI6_DESPS|nr:biopolymer transporter ExbD [Desulfotalea psychrophila]CAG37139.1 related to biopolymer transport protein (TolR) [Desulfotalea psychrophila LSv54]